jgi:predicted hydrocarbon binding protein
MYLLALEDVLGRNRFHAILNKAMLRSRIGNFPPDNLDLGWDFREMSALSQAIGDTYGRQGSKGIAIRAGQAWFYREQRDFSAALGIGVLAFRLLPLNKKIQMSLNAIADTFNKTSDQAVRVEESEKRFFYHIDSCPECWNRTSVEPICNAELGLLQESLHRATGDGRISVEEILCIAQGDPSCTFVVEQRYLG